MIPANCTLHDLEARDVHRSLSFAPRIEVKGQSKCESTRASPRERAVHGLRRRVHTETISRRLL